LDNVLAAVKEVMESSSAMKIVIGSDHAGFALKESVGDLLRSLARSFGPWRVQRKSVRLSIRRIRRARVVDGKGNAAF